MVAIFTGSGTGFERGSGSVLGGSGLLGSAGFGRSGGQVLLNAANGNLLINRQDEFLAGRGPDASVGRTYNSLGNQSDDNGDNWRQSTQRVIRNFSTGESVTRVSGDGSQIEYYWNGSAYVATDGAGAYDRLTYSGSGTGTGTWIWTDGDTGVTETYAADGLQWRIVSQSDTSGNALSYGYTGDKLTTLTTANGETLTYTWSGNHIASVNSGDGTLTRYYYDSYDRLSQVDVELTGGGAVYSTSYTYVGTSKLVATISETDGSSLTIGYDTSNRVTSLTQTVSSGVSRTTTLAYNAGCTTITDPTGQVFALWYDSNGALVQIAGPAPDGASASQVVRFGYNGNGDLTTVIDATGQTSSYTYDANGNLLTSTDRLGNVVTRTYSATNQLLTETRIGSDKDGAAAYHTTRYAYDSANRLVYTVSADGNVTRNWYNSSGQLYFITEFPEHRYDLNGVGTYQALTQAQLDSWSAGLGDTSSAQISYMSYDARGNVIRHQTASQNSGYSVYDAAGGERDERFTYDSAGRLLQRYVLGQNIESFVYDGLGRVVASTDLNGATTSFAFNDALTQTVVTLANGIAETSTYNKAGELVSYTKFGPYVTGTSTGYQYDRNGRARVYTDSSGNRFYYVYDKVGRKVAEVNGTGNLTEYRYDANNRLVATAHYATAVGASTLALLGDPNSTVEVASFRPTANDSDLWAWSVYDKEGRVIEAIDGDGSVTAYAYDASSRLVKTTGYANKLDPAQLAGFKAAAPTGLVLPADNAKDSVARLFYDKDGRTIGVLDGEGYLSRTVYDRAGRKVQEIAYANATGAAYRASGSLQNLIDSVGANANDRSTRYVYDGQGLLRYTIDALNHVTGYAYGAGSATTGLVRKTVLYAAALGPLSSYSYSSVKNAVDINASANRISWAVYDNAGRLAYSIDATGAVTGFAYDGFGQVIRKIEYANPRATIMLPSLADMNSWAASASSTLDRVNRYYYNAAGELRYTIDAEGYVTGTDYDGDGRVRFSARWDTAVSATDSWTIANVHSAVSAQWEGTNTYYDPAGRVSLVVDQTGRSQRFYYHANGLLAWEIVAEGTPDDSRTYYTYDAAGRKATQSEAHGTAQQAVTRYSYNGLGDLIAVTDPGQNTTTSEYDRAGRVIRQVDAMSGATSSEYNAFGEVTRTINARGYSTYSNHDQVGRVTSVVDAQNVSTITSYTVFGEIETVSRAGATTSFTYDKLGRLLTTTDAEGGVETQSYDAFGGVVQVQNKLGGITQYAFSRRGQLRYEIVVAPVYDSNGTQIASSYVRNTYEYDARGNVVHQIEAVDLPERRDTWFEYDKANRLTKKWGEAVSVGLSPTTVTPTEYFYYDRRGNLIEAVDAAGAHRYWVYDALNRKTAELGPTGAVRTWSYDSAGNLASERGYASLAKVPATTGLPELQVRRMYDLALGRQPNQGEIDNWSWRMANLYPGPNAVASAFAELLGDSGVQSRFPPSSTNEAFIRSVYFLAFRREPTAGEIGIWLGNMSGGMSRAQVLAFFSEHPDHVVIGAAEMVEQQVAALAGSAARETSHTYDALGRLKTSSVAGQSFGYWDGSGYVYSSGTLTTTYDYDAVGNVVAVTDPAAGVTRSIYDSLNRRVRQVDAEGYITTWAYDAEGNVYHERRWALKELAGGGDPEFTGADRITEFEYDKMGRRVAERRFYVEAWSLNNANGQLSGLYGTSLIRYTYNALGEVLTRTEARYEAGGVAQGPSDTTTYTYDSAGRLVMETRPAIALAGGGSDTPTIRYTYNALDQMTTTRQGGASISGSDRITRNLYDGAGRLTGVVDALGQTRSYVYDAVGRKIGEYYTRELGNGASVGGGSTIVEGISYEYDLAGNLVRQAVNTISGGAWTAISSTRSAYNAFGEITDRGTNVAAGSATSGWAEHFVYDTAGHLVRSNAGDGVWRVYAYDKAGRRTLSIESNGATDLSNTAQSSAVGLVAGGTVTATATLFDRRGQATDIVQMLRRTSVGGNAQNIVAKRGYTAFGELLWERDALGRQTDYYYNTMGRVMAIMRPTVSVTAANGTVSSIRPTERMFYDIAGRLIGTQDANSEWTGSGARTTRQLVAGTGYGDGAALVAKEWHPDGGIVSNGYNVFGDLVSTTDEIGRTTAMAYDKLGRLIQVTRPATAVGTLVEEYSYDILGQRIGHWNNAGVGQDYAGRERTEYDGLGRVTLQRAFGGDVTTTSYSWNAGLTTSGMGTFGGWEARTVYINSLELRSSTDQFGHLISKTDLGGHQTSAAYDLLGRLTGRTTSGAHGTETASYTWLNNGQIGTVSTTSGGITTVQTSRYDLVGNKLEEYGTRAGVVIQNASSVYDALNRLLTWSESGSNASITPAANLSYEYDANSNVRRTRSNFTALNPFDGSAAASMGEAHDYWYTYDSMNRMTVAEGILSGISNGVEVTGDGARGIGAIVRGLSGVDIAYDLAGQRTQVISTVASSHEEWDPNGYDPNAYGGLGGYTGAFVGLPSTITTREDYSYRADGLLETVRVGTTQSDTHLDGSTDPIVIPGLGDVRATYGYDLAGRLTREVSSGGWSALYDRTVSYNSANRITSETIDQRYTGSSDIYRSVTTNEYGSGIGYALGTIVSSGVKTYKNNNDAAAPDTSTSNGIAWFDGAVISSTSYTPNTANWTTWNTSYGFSPSGTVTSASISDGMPRTVSFIQAATGEVIRRDVPIAGNGAYGLDPHEVWYRFNGREMGHVANNVGMGDPAGAEFGKVYTPLTNFAHGGDTGYTASEGDTLSTVASRLWGDSNLWYKLAQANGFSSDVSLAQGQHLAIPASVVRNTNTAATFKPYNPAEVLGDTSPTTAPMPTEAKSGGCGGFGVVLAAIVSVAVMVALPQLAPFFKSFEGIVLGGLVANAAGQGVAIATGAQQSFDFKSLAMSGVASAVTAGIGPIVDVGNKIANAAINGALSNALTQGIGVATGLQSKFDFAGVAAAGVSAGVGQALGGALGSPKGNAGKFGVGTAVRTVSALANAASRSVLDGTDFGDNIMAALPDVIAQTIGSMAEIALAGRLGAESYEADRVQGSVDNASIRSVAEAGAVAGGAFSAISAANVAVGTLLGAGAGAGGVFNLLPMGSVRSIDRPAVGSSLTRNAAAAADSPSEMHIVVNAPPAFRGGIFSGKRIGQVQYVTSAEPQWHGGKFGRYEGFPGHDARFVDYGNPAKYYGKQIGNFGRNLVAQVAAGVGDTVHDLVEMAPVAADIMLGLYGDNQAISRTGDRVAGAFNALYNMDYGNALLNAEMPVAQAFDDLFLRDDVRGMTHILSSQAVGGLSTRLASAASGLGRGVVAAKGPMFSSGAALDAMPLARSPGLGSVSTTSELLERRLVPGVEGVTLDQRTVVFSDLWKMSEMHGVEFALTKEAGAWRLYSGGVSRVPTPLSADTRILAHTHPGGTVGPSPGDWRALSANYDARLAVNPRSAPYPSRVIHGPGVGDYTPFWPTNR